MIADRIEREVDIDAPVEVVWDVVTNPEHITRWFADTVEIELRVGGMGRFGYQEKATNRPALVNVQVVAVDAPHLFAYRWDFPDGATPDETNAPLVEFKLTERGDGTRLAIVESGLSVVARSAEAREAYFADHAKGWSHFAEQLRVYATTQPVKSA